MTTNLFSSFLFPDYSLTFLERYPPVDLRNLIDELIVRDKVELLYSNKFSTTDHSSVTLPALFGYYKCRSTLELIMAKFNISIDEVKEDLLHTTIAYGVSCWLSQDNKNVMSVDTSFPKELMHYGAINKNPAIIAYAVSLVGFNKDLREFSKHFPHLQELKASCVHFVQDEAMKLITREELLRCEKEAQEVYSLSVKQLSQPPSHDFNN